MAAIWVVSLCPSSLHKINSLVLRANLGGRGSHQTHGTGRTCRLRANRLGLGFRSSGCKMWVLSTLQLQWDSFQAKEI